MLSFVLTIVSTIRIRKSIFAHNLQDQMNPNMMLLLAGSSLLYIVSGVILFISQFYYYIVCSKLGQCSKENFAPVVLIIASVTCIVNFFGQFCQWLLFFRLTGVSLLVKRSSEELQREQVEESHIDELIKHTESVDDYTMNDETAISRDNMNNLQSLLEPSE